MPNHTQSIYADHAATTAVRKEVAEVMLAALCGPFGNPSSIHQHGREARALLERSRMQLAAALGCSPTQLVFTSGGTESNNMALFGIMNNVSRSVLPDHLLHRSTAGHLITVQTEHHAILHTSEALEREGFEVTYLPVDSQGRITAEQVRQAIRPNTCLISVMYVNNEIGTIQPIHEIGLVAREHGIVFHVDAVQALAHIPFDLATFPVDLMSFSAHKIEGPKGVGALYVAPRINLQPLLFGGKQERKRRAGTENIPGIAGFATAVTCLASERNETAQHLDIIGNTFLQQLANNLPGGHSDYVINGIDPRTDFARQRAPHILNISFPGIETETMLMNLDLAGISSSSGSACTSGSHETSHVLKALQLPDEVTRSAVRFSFGRTTTVEQITVMADTIAAIVRRLR